MRGLHGRLMKDWAKLRTELHSQLKKHISENLASYVGEADSEAKWEREAEMQEEKEPPSVLTAAPTAAPPPTTTAAPTTPTALPTSKPRRKKPAATKPPSPPPTPPPVPPAPKPATTSTTTTKSPEKELEDQLAEEPLLEKEQVETPTTARPAKVATTTAPPHHARHPPGHEKPVSEHEPAVGGEEGEGEQLEEEELEGEAETTTTTTTAFPTNGEEEETEDETENEGEEETEGEEEAAVAAAGFAEEGGTVHHHGNRKKHRRHNDRHHSHNKRKHKLEREEVQEPTDHHISLEGEGDISSSGDQEGWRAKRHIQKRKNDPISLLSTNTSTKHVAAFIQIGHKGQLHDLSKTRQRHRRPPPSHNRKEMPLWLSLLADVGALVPSGEQLLWPSRDEDKDKRRRHSSSSSIHQQQIPVSLVESAESERRVGGPDDSGEGELTDWDTEYPVVPVPVISKPHFCSTFLHHLRYLSYIHTCDIHTTWPT